MRNAAARLSGITSLALIMVFAPFINQASAEVSIGADSGGGTNNGSTPTDNDPRGGSHHAPAPTVYKYWSRSVATTVGTVDCAGTSSTGQLIGISYTYKYPSIMLLSDVKKIISNNGGSKADWQSLTDLEITRTALTCLYPPGFRDSNLAVVVQSTASVSIVTPVNKVLKTATSFSAWGRGDHSINAVYNSSTFASVNLIPSQYGRYQAVAQTVMQNITVRHYLGKNPLTKEVIPDEIVSFGGTWTSNPSGQRGQLNCQGWQSNWSGAWNWTSADCQAGGPGASTPTYQCAANGSTTVNNVPASQVDLFRDGREIPISWGGSPGISGNGVTNVAGLSTRLLRSGTPSGQLNNTSEVSLSLPGGNIDLLSAPNSGQTKFVSGVQQNWIGRFWWASTAGQPTVLTPEWNFSATFTVNSVKIVGIDQDGNWQIVPVQTHVDSTGSCTGASVSLNISRATNS